MPRYHFNVHDGRNLLDATGTELPDLQRARQEALRFAGSLLAGESEPTFWDGGEWHMDVTDYTGLILFTLTFIATDAHSVPKSDDWKR